jgi:hypothetical protein
MAGKKKDGLILNLCKYAVTKAEIIKYQMIMG